MTQVTENVRSKIDADKVGKWIKDNLWFAFFIVSFSFLLYSLLSSSYEHKKEVQDISKQNAGCIYLESSDLGDGQHYMICEGQIVLKRLSDEDTQVNVEEKLEEVVPTDVANEATPAK